MMSGERLSIVVSGMVSAVPRQGGAAWAVLQYVTGLRRLGHDVMLVEQLGGEGPAPGTAGYFRMVAEEFGLAGRASLFTIGGSVLTGVDRSRVERFARDADLLFNLSGSLTDEALLESSRRKVYVDLDPGFTQLWHEADGVDMGFDRHDDFVTVGLGVGTARCDVPTAGRRWITTRQPVDLGRWPFAPEPATPCLRSVGHWRGYGSITHRGRFFGQRAHSMRPLAELAVRSPIPVEFALGIDPGERDDISLLRRAGWTLIDPDRVAATPAAYARFVRSSWAELGIAKGGYVEARSGWFSDRSVCYLACGRPVIAQETGFSDHLPTGEGLFSFATVDEAIAAVDSIRADYPRHRNAARGIAEELFDSERVLPELIEAL